MKTEFMTALLNSFISVSDKLAHYMRHQAERNQNTAAQYQQISGAVCRGNAPYGLALSALRQVGRDRGMTMSGKMANMRILRILYRAMRRPSTSLRSSRWCFPDVLTITGANRAQIMERKRYRF